MDASSHAHIDPPTHVRGWLSRTVSAHPVRSLLATAVLSVTAAAILTAAVDSGTGAQVLRPSGSRSLAAGASASWAPIVQRLGRADLGKIWGVAFRGQASSYEPLSRAETEADATPAGASVDRRSNTIRFTTGSPLISLVANPPNRRDMAFRSAGLENPTIEVPRGAVVTVRFVNADSDSAHGWLLLDPIVQLGRSVHGPRAFPGAYARILGDPTSQGQPLETIRFHATAAGTYRYECPLPGHASMGMQGSLIVA